MSRREKILLGVGLGALGVSLILIAAWAVWRVRQPSAPPVIIQQAGAQNLGFEGDYLRWEDSSEMLVAPGWSLWYKTDWPDEMGTLAPPRARDVSEPRLEGDKAQHVYWRDGKNFDACLYQQVGDFTVGHYAYLSLWAKVDTDMGQHDMQTRIGIDPNGGTSPLDIQYETHPENWDMYTVGGGQWQEMTLSMKAISETVTIYACAHPRWPMRFDVYWDQGTFEARPPEFVHMPYVTRRHFVPPAPGTLWNPDLELNWGEWPGYQQPIPGYTNVFVASYWMPFWNDDFDPDTGENRQPEYNYTDREYRVLSGEVAQQYGLSAWGGFEAGIYQVVEGFSPGDTVRFSIWGLGWSSNTGESERSSDVKEGLNFRVGVDPTGGELYDAPQIVWSDYHNPYDEWHPFVVTATVQSDQISVWAYAHPTAYWIRFNQVFWDNAGLTVIEAGE